MGRVCTRVIWKDFARSTDHLMIQSSHPCSSGPMRKLEIHTLCGCIYPFLVVFIIGLLKLLLTKQLAGVILKLYLSRYWSQVRRRALSVVFGSVYISWHSLSRGSSRWYLHSDCTGLSSRTLSCTSVTSLLLSGCLGC